MFYIFSPWVIPEYMPLSFLINANSNYRSENTMRVRSQGVVFAQVIPSFGDSRKPDVQEWRSPRNPEKAGQTLLRLKGKNLSWRMDS